MRVYLPATSVLLAAWSAAGSVIPAGGTAYGVTAALREAYRDGDIEELEWVAQVTAGEAALRLLAADPTALPMRFVIAADVPDGSARPAADTAGHPAGVRLADAVPRETWASVLADDPAAAEDQRQVAAAAEALRRGASPDASVQDRIDDVAAIELGWYGVQEIPALLAAGA